VGPVNTDPTPAIVVDASLTGVAEAPVVVGGALVVVVALCAEVQAAASTTRAPSDPISHRRLAPRLRGSTVDRLGVEVRKLFITSDY
jgi:hypothetical protein